MRNKFYSNNRICKNEKGKCIFSVCFALMLLIFLCPFSLTAQIKRQFTGSVVDSVTGRGLPGVSIIVKGSNRGASTGADGTFSVQAVVGDALVISNISYEKKEVHLTGQTDLNIVLAERVSALEEAVVVGYGTQRKATLTGAVATINNKQLKRSPALNLSNALAGQLPGVIASNRSGEPGRDNSTILIRGRSTTGDNSPLVVVDGIQGVSGWERINPNDIESISVLKDASAAIYGAQAANGVILITTKRGASGKPTINYTFNQGLSQPTRVPKMASSAVFGEFVNELLAKDLQPPRWTEAELKKFADGSDPINYPSVNWYNEILKPSTFQSMHNLALRGGSENIKYSISGSYSNQDGLFKKGSTNFKTYALRTNLDAQVNKNIKVSFDMNAGIDDGNYPNSSTTNTFGRMLVVPWIPVYWPNGLPSAGIERGDNPAVMVTDATGNINDNTQRYLLKAGFDINLPFIKGLGTDGYFSYTNNSNFNKNFQKPWTVYDYNSVSNKYVPVGGGGILAPQLRETTNRDRRSLFNFRIKYERRFNDHNINTFIAAEQENAITTGFSAFRRNFLTPAIDQLFAGSLAGQEATGSASERGRKNFFGRVGYGFKDKYLVDFNFRYDGSSIFPPGNQFGFFPGVAFAWRMGKEKFIEDKFNFIDDLKLRASYGKVGNDRVAPFQYLQSYTLGMVGYNFGATPTQSLGLTAGVNPNPNITWEVLKTANLGMDGLFLKGLFGFSLDIFRQERSNILATRDLAIPSYTGLNLPNENIGVVRNNGIELELNHKKTINKFSYRVSGNVAYVKSKVIYISEASNVPTWQKAEGHSIGAQNYLNAIGIIRTKAELDAVPKVLGTKIGDLKYEDVNGDGMITFLDNVRLDRTNTPEVTFGLNFTVDYKNFSLFANFAGQTKAWQYIHENARLAVNTREELLVNRYRPGSMDSKYPILPLLDTRTDVSGLSSTFWLRDATFVRLKTLELGYSLPQSVLSRLGISGLRFYMNGNNLITVDKMKIYDPEGSDERGNFYPQSKIYNFGLNLIF
jgi:TonB-linked SusC/RagA family outer membrane protein